MRNRDFEVVREFCAARLQCTTCSYQDVYEVRRGNIRKVRVRCIQCLSFIPLRWPSDETKKEGA